MISAEKYVKGTRIGPWINNFNNAGDPKLNILFHHNSALALFTLPWGTNLAYFGHA